MTNGEQETGIPLSDLVDFALRLVREPSPSGDEGRVAALVAAEMARLGYRVETDELGNVVGTIDAGPGPCILFDAHLDTVGVSSEADWTRNPWGEVVGERLYGRGSMDMKGPLAAAIYGIASLRDALARGRVVVAATVAEELVEGPALERVAARVRPDAVVICEATGLTVARGQRGRAEIRIEVTGRPTHSSRPEFGINAADAMADVILALREIAPPQHPVLGRGILVLTDILSEPYPGLSVVPHRCVATFDRRTLPGETEEALLAPIRERLVRALARTGARGSAAIAVDDFASYTGARVEAPNFAPAWFFPDDHPLVAGALAALDAAGLPARLGHYAFCTNGSGTAGRLGIPTIGFGPGDEEMAHRVDEYVEIAQLEAAARGYAAIARRLTELG
ncbi:MAG: YgeY family selenium metabolism-linked hydrolase [Sphaerobacter sp.]|nr:YgeY family selenium metabolism-linked hydrolase [Sphaerobacter sp.]